jgi:hypothetical protein
MCWGYKFSCGGAQASCIGQNLTRQPLHQSLRLSDVLSLLGFAMLPPHKITFQYADHIDNYPDFLRSLVFGK